MPVITSHVQVGSPSALGHPTAQDILHQLAHKLPGRLTSVWRRAQHHAEGRYARGEPISFLLAGVIPGWTEGMQLVAVGGMIELDIPSELAYGPQGRPGIPPNANLRFIVELLKVGKSDF